MFQHTLLPYSAISVILLVIAMTTVSAVDPDTSMTANNMTAMTITTPSPSLVVDTAVAGSSASMLRGAQPLGKNELKLEDLFAANNNGERPQNRKLWGGWIGIHSNYDGEATRTRKYLNY